MGRLGLRPRYGHLPHRRRQRGLPDQWIRPLSDSPVRRCDPRRARHVSLCAARNADRPGGLGGGLALAPARRRDPGRARAAGTRFCQRALRQPLLPRHAPAPRCRAGARGPGRSPVASGMMAVVRLFSRIVLRPGPSLLVLGAAILASNWVWYGSGIFLGQPAGLVLTIAGLLGFGYAAYGLVRGRHQLRALSIFIVAAVLLPALALIALRSTTGVRLWHWYVNQPLDSSLFHYVYSPLTFLLGVPFFVASRLLAIPFDFRSVLILAALAAAGGLLGLPWRWELRYVAFAALFLNPFFYFPQGRNDILFLAPLTLGVLAWARGKPRLAALAFGVAFALKPFAIFFLPCVAIALWPRSGPLLDRVRRLAMLGAALLAPAALTMGPFLLWNAPAYWTDTVSFVAGTIPGAYRIQGYSLASLLLALHLIPSADARFPFGLVQAAVAAPVLAVGLWRIWRAPSLASVLAVGTLALALSLLAARFVNDNYLADLLYLTVLAGAARQASAATIATSRPIPAAA
ncbi:MAG: DUF2029 domain-containing protein [Chloroflexi bacterium]|nr:MAG: DUF2029 domain-containing protein [Chloroflexota bacterium]